MRILKQGRALTFRVVAMTCYGHPFTWRVSKSLTKLWWRF